MRATCGVVSARRPERAAAELVDELEGLQVELMAGARQQRLEVLEQRRHHQLEAVAARAGRAGCAAAPRCAAPARAGHRRCARAAAKQTTWKNAGGLKTALYRPARAAAGATLSARTAAAAPARSSMLLRPRKRIWPSLSCVARSNTRRQRAGLRNGSRPSSTSISATAPSSRSDHGAGAPRLLAPALRVRRRALPRIAGRTRCSGRPPSRPILRAEARAVGLEAAIELRELRVAAEGIRRTAPRPWHRPRP